MDFREVFAANLRRARHRKKLSQEALADEAGIDRSYLSKLERADTYVGLEILVKLATILCVEPADFLKVPERRDGRRN